MVGAGAGSDKTAPHKDPDPLGKLLSVQHSGSGAFLPPTQSTFNKNTFGEKHVHL